MAPTANRTRGDDIFNRLRFDILTSHFEPGAKLRFAELSERYRTSTGVLREVLPRLVEQGLASSEAHLGFSVVTISAEELLSLTDARVEIETLVTRLTIARGDLEWESSLVAAHHALTRTPFATDDAGKLGEWIAQHENFHITLLRGCGNQYLVDASTKLRAIAGVYRYWSIDEELRTHRDIAKEHQDILNAAISRDADECVRLQEIHIRTTTENMIASRLGGSRQAG